MAKKMETDETLVLKMIDDPVTLNLLGFFEELVLDRFAGLEKSMTLQLGCSTKTFSEALAEKTGDGSRLIIIEPSAYLLDNVRLHLETRSSGTGKLFFKSDFNWSKLPFDDDVFQSIVSVLFWDRSPNRFRMLNEMSRVLEPSGMALLTAYLSGTMREFFDLFAEVITKFDMQDLLQPLQEVKSMFLSKMDYEMLANECGFSMCKVTQHTHTMRFSSAKELFFSPTIQFYWHPLWEKIAGKDSERIFWHIRQSMDRYFSGKKIPLTIVAGMMVAIK
ncbi:MAG: methyltransferase domain-containing protein [Pseudomonadota bacterium]